MPGYLDWFVWSQRLSVEPGVLRRVPAHDRSTRTSPTFCPRSASRRSSSRRAGSREPGAHVAEPDPERDGRSMLPGEGLSLHENDAGLDAIESFLRDEAPPEYPDTVLATVLFTDLVGSTELAAEIGDRSWREVLEAHHARVRRELLAVRRRRAGHRRRRVLRHLRRSRARDRLRPRDRRRRCRRSACRCASASTPVSASAWARSWRGSRSTSARESQPRPAPGEVLVSGTVRDLVAGSGFAFEDLGEHELKGVPGSWRLLRVVA